MTLHQGGQRVGRQVVGSHRRQGSSKRPYWRSDAVDQIRIHEAKIGWWDAVLAPNCSMRLGIASTFPPYRGGIAQFNAAMSRALEAEGHQVGAVTWSRQYPSWLFPGTSQWEPQKTLQDADMPAILDSMSPRTWALAGKALAEAADVVILPFWHAALALMLLQRLFQAVRSRFGHRCILPRPSHQPHHPPSRIHCPSHCQSIPATEIQCCRHR